MVLLLKLCCISFNLYMDGAIFFMLFSISIVERQKVVYCQCKCDWHIHMQKPTHSSKNTPVSFFAVFITRSVVVSSSAVDVEFAPWLLRCLLVSHSVILFNTFSSASPSKKKKEWVPRDTYGLFIQSDQFWLYSSKSQSHCLSGRNNLQSEKHCLCSEIQFKFKKLPCWKK